MKTLNQVMEEECGNRIKLCRDIFSERLKELREERQLSQKDIADKLGCAVSTYANWEQGRREPSLYDIFNLIWIYEIEANKLFNIDGIM